MLFQFLLTKFSNSEPASCLHKVDHVTNYCKKKKKGLLRGNQQTPTQGFSSSIFYGKRPAHEVDA